LILWNDLGVKLQYELYFLLGGLLIVSALYSSVGHGGASGYLALLSLSSYGAMSSIWLKQHVWVMNVVVASIAFFHYNKSGHHNIKLTIPFILASIPMALIGGMLAIDGNMYDLLLSITLVWASYKIINFSSHKISNNALPNTFEPYFWGGGIGFLSGLIGIGGGIFLSPILLLKGWANVKTAAATAALFIVVNSISGLAGTAISGNLDLDFSLLGLFLITIALGGYVGSKYGAKHASNSVVRKLLAIVLIFAATKRIIELF
tara:strand:- start:2554 stop:3339 length:786 start_codon:yes stop_codon:yes gene_type:complete